MKMGLKLPLHKDSGVGMLKISLNKCKKLKLQKICTKYFKKSMQTIQLKLFNLVLKHEIIESNKETFIKISFIFTNIILNEIFGNYFALLRS